MWSSQKTENWWTPKIISKTIPQSLLSQRRLFLPEIFTDANRTGRPVLLEKRGPSCYYDTVSKLEGRTVPYGQISFCSHGNRGRFYHRAQRVRRRARLFYGNVSAGRVRSGRNSRPFVQDNQSKSTKGVLRGLHFRKSTPRANWCVWCRARCST